MKGRKFYIRGTTRYSLRKKRKALCNVLSYAFPVTWIRRCSLLVSTAILRDDFPRFLRLPAFTIPGSLCAFAKLYSFSSSNVNISCLSYAPYHRLMKKVCQGKNEKYKAQNNFSIKKDYRLTIVF